MILKSQVEWALHCCAILAGLPAGRYLSTKALAEFHGLPKEYLSKALQSLSQAGLVDTTLGPSGGYRLARRPEDIPLAVIVRHLEGALAPVSCVSERFYEKCSCPDESRCAIRSVMKEVREAVVKIVERLTVSDLCERWRRLQHEPVNPFDFTI